MTVEFRWFCNADGVDKTRISRGRLDHHLYIERRADSVFVAFAAGNEAQDHSEIISRDFSISLICNSNAEDCDEVPILFRENSPFGRAWQDILLDQWSDRMMTRLELVCLNCMRLFFCPSQLVMSNSAHHRLWIPTRRVLVRLSFVRVSCWGSRAAHGVVVGGGGRGLTWHRSVWSRDCLFCEETPWCNPITVRALRLNTF